MSDPALALSTLEPDRAYVTIDGKAYDLRTPMEFGLADQAKLERWQREWSKLQADNAELSDEEIGRASKVLHDAVRMVLIDADRIIDKLTDSQCVAVLRVFPLAALRVQADAKTKSRRSQRTSRKSSRVSAVSTAPTTG